MRTLIIVESPAKARTLGNFLSKDYTVKASVGHIRDLPFHEMGVDVDNDFRPTYVIVEGKTVLTRLSLRVDANLWQTMLGACSPRPACLSAKYSPLRALSVSDQQCG
jgi:DNA topoisomerase-1